MSREWFKNAIVRFAIKNPFECFSTKTLTKIAHLHSKVIVLIAMHLLLSIIDLSP